MRGFPGTAWSRPLAMVCAVCAAACAPAVVSGDAGDAGGLDGPDGGLDAGPDAGDPGPASDAGVASRASGVAPLAVHFSAEAARSTDSARPFHHDDFSWDFGDPAAGTWGPSGKPRNVARGAVAAHVYETPGTYTARLTIRRAEGGTSSQPFSITVLDPATVYAGTSTTCVSDATSSDFTGCPAGARQLATDDLTTVVASVTAGSRLLFRRGSTWTTGALAFPNSAGPVTVGAYGASTGTSSQGIHANAPRFVVSGGPFLTIDRKQDWRVMDLHLVDTTRQAESFGGALDMQRFLFLRVKVEGFGTALGWSHWNGTPPKTIDQMVIADCELSDARTNVAYVGAERLALLGNVIADARESHVLRVWQAYKGVISHNVISGSSLDNTAGRHALKLHGPGNGPGTNEYGTPLPSTGLLEHQTAFAVVSDNVFGSSGPWPVGIGPQDSAMDEALWDVLFERNRLVSSYGSQSATGVQIALNVWARDLTVRNNVFDGTASTRYYTAVAVSRRGGEPPATRVDVLHNTIYRADTAQELAGVSVASPASKVVVRNNLVSFPGAAIGVLLRDSSADLVADHNLLTATPGFVDPDNATPLSRDFRLGATSPALGQGVAVPVLEDFYGNARPATAPDLGACERP